MRVVYYPRLITLSRGNQFCKEFQLRMFLFSSDRPLEVLADSVAAFEMEKSAAAAAAPAPAVSNGHKPKLVIEEKVNEKQGSKLAQEEADIESKIVQHILDGQWESLRPNSGTSVDIKGSHLCVDYHEEEAYRVWEWHGHCMIYEDGEGYTPEYIYGNYFEPLVQEEDVSRPVGLGLIANSGRNVAGLEGIFSPLGRPGSLPMRDILDEAYRRVSK